MNKGVSKGMDKIFALRAPSGKYVEEREHILIKFMALKKAYGRLDKNDISKMPQSYGVQCLRGH